MGKGNSVSERLENGRWRKLGAGGNAAPLEAVIFGGCGRHVLERQGGATFYSLENTKTNEPSFDFVHTREGV